MTSVVKSLTIGEVELVGLIDRIEITRTNQFTENEWSHFMYLVEQWYNDSPTANIENGVKGIHIQLLERRIIQVFIVGDMDHFLIRRISEELQAKLQIVLPKVFFGTFMDKVFIGEPGSDIG